jgi:hypothetical protein
VREAKRRERRRSPRCYGLQLCVPRWLAYRRWRHLHTLLRPCKRTAQRCGHRTVGCSATQRRAEPRPPDVLAHARQCAARRTIVELAIIIFPGHACLAAQTASLRPGQLHQARRGLCDCLRASGTTNAQLPLITGTADCFRPSAAKRGLRKRPRRGACSPAAQARSGT